MMADSPPSFITSMVASFARHAGTGIAGALVANGVLTNSQSTELIDLIGAFAVAGVSLWWSYIQKKNASPQPVK